MRVYVFAQVALYHERSRTLLVTDAVCYTIADRDDWLSQQGARDRSAPFNLYPSDWSPARKKALDQMQVTALDRVQLRSLDLVQVRVAAYPGGACCCAGKA